MDEAEKAGLTTDYNEDQIRTRVIYVKAAAMYQKLFGQCSPRNGWGKVLDLTAKDKLPADSAMEMRVNSHKHETIVDFECKPQRHFTT